MFIYLLEDNQDKVLKEKTAVGVWSQIKTKYSKVYTAYAMAVVEEFVTFRMLEEWTIRKA